MNPTNRKMRVAVGILQRLKPQSRQELNQTTQQVSPQATPQPQQTQQPQQVTQTQPQVRPALPAVQVEQKAHQRQQYDRSQLGVSAPEQYIQQPDPNLPTAQVVDDVAEPDPNLKQELHTICDAVFGPGSSADFMSWIIARVEDREILLQPDTNTQPPTVVISFYETNPNERAESQKDTSKYKTGQHARKESFTLMRKLKLLMMTLKQHGWAIGWESEGRRKDLYERKFKENSLREIRPGVWANKKRKRVANSQRKSRKERYAFQTLKSQKFSVRD